MQFDALKAKVMAMLQEGLPTTLTYHSLAHTLDVLAATEQLGAAEGISGDALQLLRTAALLHDTGFLRTYHQHEEASVRIAESLLPAYGYTPAQVTHVAQMIRATRIPQTPNDALSAILCDADLDYLGRDDYDPIAETLYREFLHYGVLESEAQWLQVQIKFLGSHRYFTSTSLASREAGKQAVLARLQQVDRP
jgi:HD superfamily phosphodiesterase